MIVPNKMTIVISIDAQLKILRTLMAQKGNAIKGDINVMKKHLMKHNMLCVNTKND